MKRGQRIIFLTVVVQWAILSKVLSQSHWETAIYAEDTWYYFVGITAPPVNWNNLTLTKTTGLLVRVVSVMLMEMITPPFQTL